jgi:hypothetical protein
MRSAADAGRPKAQYALGTFHATGVGTKADPSAAMAAFLAAARGGHVRAQFEVARRYLAGDGVVVDPVRAWLWRTIAERSLAPAVPRQAPALAARFSAAQRASSAALLAQCTRAGLASCDLPPG